MNWDALGALGENVGAIAVVFTLIYLAVQTRQNTEAVRHAFVRGVMEDANAWRFKIVEDPAISELFRNGPRDPGSLVASDEHRFRMFLDALVFHWQHAVISGIPIPAANITRVLSRPGGAWYRARARDGSSHDSPTSSRTSPRAMASRRLHAARQTVAAGDQQLVPIDPWYRAGGGHRAPALAVSAIGCS